MEDFSTKTIEQHVNFPCTAAQFYQDFMDSEAHSAIIGAPTEISGEIGGQFSAFDGYCHGENLELIPGQRIVQTWIAEQDNWPEGHVSKIILELQAIEEGVSLRFVHENVPLDAADGIAQGWYDFYWNNMQQRYSA